MINESKNVTQNEKQLYNDTRINAASYLDATSVIPECRYVLVYKVLSTQC